MLKRFNLRQIMFNDYAVDGYLDPNCKDSYVNLFVDNDFEIINQGLDVMISSVDIYQEGSIFNTCILQPKENEQYLEFRALNNYDGTVTYMILRPLNIGGVSSYVPVLNIGKVTKTKNVYGLKINNEQAIMQTMNMNISSDKVTLEKILAYFEILRIKLLVKESYQTNGYNVESVIKALAHNTFSILYKDHMDFHKSILYYSSEVDKDLFSDMFDASATHLIIKNKSLHMPIDEAIFVDGKIFIMVDVSKENRTKNLCTVTLGNNTVFSKMPWTESDDIFEISKNSVAADREDMIELELNPFLRNLFKLINKSK